MKRTLLNGGIAAGPVYVGVGLVEALTREGFDIRRHALSLLSNGKWGWIHMAMFIVTGLLVILGAVGMRRVLRGGRGGTFGPLLLGLYGLGLIGAGCFRADPGLGFPPGTPETGNPITTHGMMHFVCGGIGFIGLIGACLVLARRFAGRKEAGWAAFSVATGVLFLAGFVGIATGSAGSAAMRMTVNLGFTAVVVLSWIWLSAVSARLKMEI